MSVKDRLIDFLKYKGLSQSKFEKSIGASNGYINSMRKGIGAERLEQVRREYPDLNIDWLLSGNGNMLNSQGGKEDVTGKNVKFAGVSVGVPYYEDIESTGTIMSMNNDYRETPAFFINYEHFNDCTAYLTHVGDSMYPKYCSGEIIAVKRIFNFDIVLWGEAYLVVTNENANNLRTVKLVFPHDDEGKIVLRASNPNFKGDTVVNKSDIVSMFIVKGKITRNQL